MGSVDAIIPARELRPYLIGAVERGIGRSPPTPGGGGHLTGAGNADSQSQVQSQVERRAMHPFILNRHGRMVFPSNFMPELDLSVIDSWTSWTA